MHLIDQITAAWAHAKTERFGLIATDPNPVYSRLDRLDGLR
jgi:hypothetical protein